MTLARQYIGTKIIKAWPEENSDGRKGYAVVYQDGYQSWSPKAAFDDAYRPTTNMNFGLAIEAAKMGRRIARLGWNGKDMYICYVQGRQWLLDDDLPLDFTDRSRQPMLVMKTAQSMIVPWLASQSDMLSDDWYLLSIPEEKEELPVVCSHRNIVPYNDEVNRIAGHKCTDCGSLIAMDY